MNIPSTSTDLILHNGTVTTLDRSNPIATAVAIRNGRFLVMDIAKNHFGAYGIGVEYCYTMVHGAPPSRFPEYVVPAGARAHK